jgi:adenylate cyclase
MFQRPPLSLPGLGATVTLADPGGICVSGTVYEHIKNKLTLSDEYLGEHSVKNIDGSVEVYRLLLEPQSGEAVRSQGKAERSGRRTAITIAAVLLMVTVGYAALNYMAGSDPGTTEAAPASEATRPVCGARPGG